MLKIVVVDDEQIVLDGMKMILETSGRDWVVVGTALDGKQGLAEIRKTRPDIVVSDIKMPEMDGLEMSRIVKEEFPETVIFVFSGYAEFNLAQKAIGLGIHDYLLKPANYESIYESLEKAQQYIEEKRRFHLEQEELRKKLQSSIPVLKEKLLTDLIHGTIGTNDSIFYRLEYLKFSISNAFLATLKIDDFNSVTQKDSVEDKYLLLFAVRNITEEICGYFCEEFFVINDSDDSLCIIVNNQDHDRKVMMSLCEEIRVKVHDFLKITVSIGVGRFVKGLETLQLAYKDSLTAIQGSLFKSRNVTVHIDEVLKDVAPAFYSLAMEKNIIEAVKLGEPELLQNELEVMFRQLKDSSHEYVKRVCYELFISLSRSLYEAGINIEDACKDQCDIYAKLSASTGVEDIMRLTAGAATKIAEHVCGVKKTHRSKIIDGVLKCIEENYARNISLKEAADKVYLNINYLSELFKAEMGENFSEYLKKYRVKKAIELMDRMDLKIYHISEMVGYSDSKHFSQVFKEITGVSPKDYKAGIKPVNSSYTVDILPKNTNQI